MEISVSSILHSPQAVTRYPFEERFDLHSEVETLVDPVRGDLTVTRTSNQVLQVQGRFHTRVRLVCDRCGSDFELPVDFSLDEPLEVVEGPLSATEVEEAVTATGTLDATDLVRQGLLLNLPVRKLCGCEPLPQQSEQERQDPRWAALKALREQPQGKD
ncbi:MAG TPA: DUF177 domain-containing protein [Oscillatoriaceae cyanobacterium]